MLPLYDVIMLSGLAAGDEHDKYAEHVRQELSWYREGMEREREE
jgi:hypothetical protein